MEAINWLFSNLGSGKFTKIALGIVAFCSIFIEFIPVKWCPVTSLLKWIGKRANGEMIKKMEGLQTKVINLEKEIAKVQYCNSERNARDCRIRILRFGDEVRLGINHSKESFEQSLEDIDNYESYCKNHPEFKNNKTCLTIKKIKEAYQETMDKNNFL